MGKWEVIKGDYLLKISDVRHPTDILECALEYQKIGNPCCKINRKDGENVRQLVRHQFDNIISKTLQ